MSHEDIVVELLKYLGETNPIVKSGMEIPRDKSLYEMGLLDSFGVVEMVSFIENHWGIKIPNRDLTKERFGGLNAMSAIIFNLIQNK